MRTTLKKRITSLNEIKPRILSWAQQFEEVVWLDSNAFNDNYSSFKAVLAVDAFTAIKTDSYQAFDKLEEYQTTTKDWPIANCFAISSSCLFSSFKYKTSLCLAVALLNNVSSNSKIG